MATKKKAQTSTAAKNGVHASSKADIEKWKEASVAAGEKAGKVVDGDAEATAAKIAEENGLDAASVLEGIRIAKMFKG